MHGVFYYFFPVKLIHLLSNHNSNMSTLILYLSQRDWNHSWVSGWKKQDSSDKVKSLSRVWLFATPWTVACQPPPSMGFSRREYWSGLPFPSPVDLPDPGIDPGSPALEADALTSEPPGKQSIGLRNSLFCGSFLQPRKESRKCITERNLNPLWPVSMIDRCWWGQSMYVL